VGPHLTSIGRDPDFLMPLFLSHNSIMRALFRKPAKICRELQRILLKLCFLLSHTNVEVLLLPFVQRCAGGFSEKIKNEISWP